MFSISTHQYLEVRQPCTFWKIMGFGCAHDLEYPKQLSDFTVSLEEHAPMNNFKKYAAKGPYIKRMVVEFGSKQHLWSPIPESSNLEGDGGAIAKYCFTETEIGDFDRIHIINEDILGLEVPMVDIPLVEVMDSTGNFMEYFLS